MTVFNRDTEERMERLVWMTKVYEKWPTYHPIPQNWLQTQLKVAKKKNNTTWKLVKNRDDVLEFWTKQMAEDWLFEEKELRLKGGGVSALKKAYCMVFKSKHTAKLWVAIAGPFKGSIVVDGLIKAMRIIYQDTSISDCKRGCMFIKVFLCIFYMNLCFLTLITYNA